MPYTTINTPKNNPAVFKFLVIRDEISANPNKDEQSLINLCRRFSMGRKVLLNGFKRNFGYSLAFFVKEYCLTRGLEQLATCSHERVYDIAVRLGYADESSFTRAFKHRFHCAPGEYKNKLKLLNKMAGRG